MHWSFTTKPSDRLGLQGVREPQFSDYYRASSAQKNGLRWWGDVSPWLHCKSLPLGILKEDLNEKTFSLPRKQTIESNTAQRATGAELWPFQISQQLQKNSKDVTKVWVEKQAMLQIYLSGMKNLPRAKSNESKPSKIHQADLLFLPHDAQQPGWKQKTYKYGLTAVDVAANTR